MPGGFFLSEVFPFVESKNTIRIREHILIRVGIPQMKKVKNKLLLMQRAKSKIYDGYFITKTWIKE